MPSINNWPKELVEELHREAMNKGDWRKLYEQQWPMEMIVKDPGEPPRDAVRIHLQKDRWPRRGWHAFKDPETDRLITDIRFGFVYEDEVPQEPEQPYKSDPRFGTWG
jgi:hypothetical protein